MRPRIIVRLFGRFSVHFANQEILRHSSTHAKEVLAYLAMNRRVPIPRESLANLISERAPKEKTRKALRQALWQLNAGLAGRKMSEEAPMLKVDNRWVQLLPGDDVWVDVEEFERTAGVSDARSSNDTRASRHALELYRGELLQGWYQEWCLGERERLKQIYLEVLDKLVARFEADRNLEAGLAYATLALRAEAARECTHRSLMRLFCAAGDRASALRQYQRCCSALRQELAIEPDEETRALEREIRAGHPRRSGSLSRRH
jgi:DNA-binding SARP family transcriptional activator